MGVEGTSVLNRPLPVARNRVAWVHIARSFLTLALFLTPGLEAAEIKPAITRETDLKAVFLFNFTQFVDWPPEAFAEAGAAFVLCVLGDDPFGESLDEVVAGEAMQNHPIVTRRFRELEGISTCHLLYVSASESQRLEYIFDALDGAHVLTVGETDQFSFHNGIIQFLLVDNRLRLRINVEAAKAAKLSISSQLLRQAEIVGER